ncbi:hypothetical protein BC629DRAFT_1436511 [Irpex lacteus]|nr:hypothetical protein BC629DRAFT_1436511 [Irpex lacteus]
MGKCGDSGVGSCDYSKIPAKRSMRSPSTTAQEHPIASILTRSNKSAKRRTFPVARDTGNCCPVDLDAMRDLARTSCYNWAEALSRSCVGDTESYATAEPRPSIWSRTYRYLRSNSKGSKDRQGSREAETSEDDKTGIWFALDSSEAVKATIRVFVSN